jgi:type IV pilus assembly protein PilE
MGQSSSIENSPHGVEMARASRGFTLVELLVAVVVIAILAAVAVPAYRDQIRKGRRAEAHEALMQVQAAQERWRSNNVTYAATVAALGQSAVSASGNYAITVSGATATGYTATATAQAKQAGDSACAAITAVVANNVTTYGPTNACWAR